MGYFVIVETDDGFVIGQVAGGANPESVALKLGGQLTDEGPFDSFEEAQDVLLTLSNPYEADAEDPG